jgi:hypothetical protein
MNNACDLCGKGIAKMFITQHAYEVCQLCWLKLCELNVQWKAETQLSELRAAMSVILCPIHHVRASLQRKRRTATYYAHRWNGRVLYCRWPVRTAARMKALIATNGGRS